MRISDWSSDVCSSDLRRRGRVEGKGAEAETPASGDRPRRRRQSVRLGPRTAHVARAGGDESPTARPPFQPRKAARYAVRNAPKIVVLCRKQRAFRLRCPRLTSRKRLRHFRKCAPSTDERSVGKKSDSQDRYSGW